MSVPIFCCPFVSQKLFGEVSRNWLEIYVNNFHEETRPELGGRLQGAPQGPYAPQAWPIAWLCLGPTWRPPTSSRVALSPVN